jgi:hypothetical protein
MTGCGPSIIQRLRAHVAARGGPTVANGAWQMMLDAADRIETLEMQQTLDYLALRRANARGDRCQAIVVALNSELRHLLTMIAALDLPTEAQDDT